MPVNKTVGTPLAGLIEAVKTLLLEAEKLDGNAPPAAIEKLKIWSAKATPLSSKIKAASTLILPMLITALLLDISLPLGLLALWKWTPTKADINFNPDNGNDLSDELFNILAHHNVLPATSLLGWQIKLLQSRLFSNQEINLRFSTTGELNSIKNKHKKIYHPFQTSRQDQKNIATPSLNPLLHLKEASSASSHINTFKSLSIEDLFEARSIRLFKLRGEKACIYQEKLMSKCLATPDDMAYLKSQLLEHEPITDLFTKCMSDPTSSVSHKLHCLWVSTKLLDKNNDAVTKAKTWLDEAKEEAPWNGDFEYHLLVKKMRKLESQGLTQADSYVNLLIDALQSESTRKQTCYIIINILTPKLSDKSIEKIITALGKAIYIKRDRVHIIARQAMEKILTLPLSNARVAQLTYILGYRVINYRPCRSTQAINQCKIIGRLVTLQLAAMPDELINTLIAALENPAPAVRIAACQALGDTVSKLVAPPEKLITALINRLNDKDSKVCTAAHQALILASKSESIPEKTLNAFTRYKYLTADKAYLSISFLINALKELPPTFIAVLINELKFQGVTASSSTPLFSAPPREIHSYIMACNTLRAILLSPSLRQNHCFKVNIEQISKRLINLLKHENNDVCQAACKTLGVLALVNSAHLSNGLVNALINTLNHTEESVAQTACQALGSLIPTLSRDQLGRISSNNSQKNKARPRYRAFSRDVTVKNSVIAAYLAETYTNLEKNHEAIASPSYS